MLHDACPECCLPGEVDPWGGLIAEFARPDPLEHDLHFDHYLTPEGELAGTDTGRFEVEDRVAFAAWADEVFVRTGQAWAHVIEVDGAPWTRALFWFNGDGQLVLQAASGSRYAHLSLLFERIWPPVHRRGRSGGALRPGDLAREPFEGWPPTEASVHTRLTFRQGTGRDPNAPPAVQADR